eukprot:GHRR01021761.1.p1 GENE.GHRR01021761.1~~GHRR01021761.1.p1  ORF type:complete len:226 (-),score=39.22 GHRR01021761.1:1019-1663(-)
MAAITKVTKPATTKEALQSDYAEQWLQAMDEELSPPLANDTWTLKEAPAGVSPIPVKRTYKVKRDANGSIERFKEHLVAKDFNQQEGIDCDKVFAPVSRYTSLRALLAFVVAQDLELHQLDIKKAFLNGEIQETMYVQQPPGYAQGDKQLVCWLNKALYRLRQAQRAWHLKLKVELESIGFTASEADPGLFVFPNKHKSTLPCSHHVLLARLLI